MDGIRSSREAAGVSSQCAGSASFAPGRGNPAEPGKGVGRAPRRSWHRVPTRGSSGRPGPVGGSGWLGSRGRCEAGTRAWRCLRGNFAGKSRGSEKGKQSPTRPLPPASSTRRAEFAPSLGFCVQRPLFQVCYWGAGEQ